MFSRIFGRLLTHRNIWTLDVDCSPAGKRSRAFCVRRLNTSKSKIRLFMKNLVSKTSRHQANTQSWRKFHTWPGLAIHSHGWAVITVDHYTIRLSNHYGWSLHVQDRTVITAGRYTYKAEQSLRLIITPQGWEVIIGFIMLQVHLIVQEPTGETAKWGPGWSRWSEGPPPREARIRHN